MLRGLAAAEAGHTQAGFFHLHGENWVAGLEASVGEAMIKPHGAFSCFSLYAFVSQQRAHHTH